MCCPNLTMLQARSRDLRPTENVVRDSFRGNDGQFSAVQEGFFPRTERSRLDLHSEWRSSSPRTWASGTHVFPSASRTEWHQRRRCPPDGQPCSRVPVPAPCNRRCPSQRRVQFLRLVSPRCCPPRGLL